MFSSGPTLNACDPAASATPVDQRLAKLYKSAAPRFGLQCKTAGAQCTLQRPGHATCFYPKPIRVRLVTKVVRRYCSI